MQSAPIPKTVADYAAFPLDARIGRRHWHVLEYAINYRAPLAAIRDLLQRGAKTTFVNETIPGGTLLHYLGWLGYDSRLGEEEWNREMGKRVKRQDWTTRDLIRMLVQEFKMDPNARDARGHTPLWYAIWTAVYAYGDPPSSGGILAQRLQLLDPRNVIADNPVKGLYEMGADVEDPDLDTIPAARAKAYVKKIRALRRGRIAGDVLRKEILVKEAITQQAEATPLHAEGEEPRMMTGVPPRVPGPSIVKQFLSKGGRKTKKVRRSRKSTHRSRRI